MLDVRYSAQFKKDFDRMKKRGFPMHELKYIIETPVQEKPLAQKHCDHALKGKPRMPDASWFAVSFHIGMEMFL